VVIEARRDGDRVRVEVTDDGPGFSSDALREGHGLLDLRARLRALHGETGTLEILARASGGGAGIVVPFRTGDVA
jgi:signal transduction histidine kinase